MLLTALWQQVPFAVQNAADWNVLWFRLTAFMQLTCTYDKRMLATYRTDIPYTYHTVTEIRGQRGER